MRKVLLAVVILAGLGLAGCATEVIRKEPKEVVDLSGRWNDTDARLTAEEMIKSCLETAWLANFNKEKGRDPVVIVGTVNNRSHEHINSLVFVEDLEQTLVNSGKVRFVASSPERGEVRAERVDQLQNAAPETRAEMVREKGADFMLQGSINSIKDEIKGEYAVLFQVNLELVDMTTNEKVWIGQKKIKKLVKRPQYTI
ncbi:MAG: penicillin-binding protein activator LpoB [Candidatus Omnitrophica bacterium]|nr:penicillin-binding protein activator LpoB [Candidatus Omnitrophota bacterium]